jgi:hypothetical protein
MRVARHDGRIVLTDTVGPFWILGAMFVVGGVMGVMASAGLAATLGQVAPWQRLAGLLIGAGVAAAGVWWLGLNPQTTSEFDPAAREARLTKTGVAGREVRVVAFDEILAVTLEYGADSDGDPVCRPALRLQQGGSVRLSELWSHDRPAADAALRAVAAVTGAPIRA